MTRSPLEQFAVRLGEDSFFLAAALASFAASEPCDDAQVAARLGCPLETLTHLRMCRMPRTEPPQFRQDVEKIAQRYAVDADCLAEIIRHGQSLLRLRDQQNHRGRLMAARDRPKKPESGDQS